MNHDKIAEGVSNALDDLSDDIRYWRQTLDVYEDNALMGEYVAKLYVVVFNFLAGIMTKWAKSSVARFLRSFDSNFFIDQVEEKKTKIRDLEHRLERQGSLAMKSSVKEAPTKEDIAKIVSASQAKFHVEFLLQAEHLKRELGYTLKNALQEDFLNTLWAQRDELLLNPDSPSARPREAAPMSAASDHVEHIYLKKKVQLSAHRLLQQDTTQQHVVTMFAQSQHLDLHHEIFDKVRQWSAAEKSQALWINGPFQATTPSRYTLLSTYVLATAQRASISAISYFCEPDADLVKMLYSLILQLVELIPNDFQSALDFSTARFEVLDGTISTLGEAVDLLKDLLLVGPYLVFVLIDGLQMLDNPSNSGPLTDFVEGLHSSAMLETSPRMLKILFTTDGFVEALTLFKAGERLDALDFTGEDDGAAETDTIEMEFL